MKKLKETESELIRKYGMKCDQKYSGNHSFVFGSTGVKVTPLELAKIRKIAEDQTQEAIRKYKETGEIFDPKLGWIKDNKKIKH